MTSKDTDHIDPTAPRLDTTAEHSPTPAITNAVLDRMFLRSLSLEVSYNYERQQALGFAFTMIPALKALYKTDTERAEALQRHLEFFNTTPYVSQLIVGVAAATEEQQSRNPSIDKSTVNSIKASLMGPFAGIGDSLYWGTIRLLVTGIGTSLALQGNILGPILFFFGFNIPVQFLSWLYLRQGYRQGSALVSRIASSGGMEKLTYGAGILGLMVIGGMSAKMVKIYTPISYGTGDKATSLQAILDAILPAGLALGAFWIIYWLLGKGWRTTHVLLLIFGFGMVTGLLGILGLAPSS